MTISAILGRKGDQVVSVECGTTVREAVAKLTAHRIGALPVTRDGKAVGILSERDIIYCLDSEGASILDRPVDKVMTAPAISVETDVPVLSALSQMSARRIRHLPVVEGERLIGIVSIGDLVAYRIARIEEEAEAMRGYIQGT
ncbi:MAG: CBS domain-containing protein [Sphingosinicella sp.]|nr:CBS domain-containing protein [Sphingosinicella sp.]